MILENWSRYLKLFHKITPFDFKKALNERKKRLKYIEENSNIHNCHSIMNCTSSCPKGLNPAKAIADLKKQIATNI